MFPLPLVSGLPASPAVLGPCLPTCFQKANVLELGLQSIFTTTVQSIAASWTCDHVCCINNPPNAGPPGTSDWSRSTLHSQSRLGVFFARSLARCTQPLGVPPPWDLAQDLPRVAGGWCLPRHRLGLQRQCKIHAHKVLTAILASLCSTSATTWSQRLSVVVG